jgi:hypothetical protein
LLASFGDPALQSGFLLLLGCALFHVADVQVMADPAGIDDEFIIVQFASMD